MDQTVAMDLVKKGSTLLLLDVPQGTLVGLDTQVFITGPIFKGIKMIPPGPHFIYYCSSNREGKEFSPIFGFFVTTSYSEVIVRKWSNQEERLVKFSEEEELRYSAAVKHLEFDKQLGPYPLEHFKKWKNFSNYITENTIERLEPIGGEISVAYESCPIKTNHQETMEINAEQLKNNKLSTPVGESKKPGCCYTYIPRFIKRKDTTQEELTTLNLDKTSLLEIILKNNFGDSDDLLLGELQFSFIAFLMGQSLEAFYQWKALVSLLFSCTHAPLHTRTRMFTKFIRVLYFQLRHACSSDGKASVGGSEKGISFFLDDCWFSKDIFLYRLCKEFIFLIEEATAIDGDLLSRTKKLKKLLETSFGWDFQYSLADMIDEDDEFSPVVVSVD
ncbi:AAR2 protein family [Zostera marina]|uniref:AAR2 protein family n=1 Tax=Zostera marina TaxID=29655 RepID=A0A0K9PIX9_ZOSMR|nr:AAR2 protein family [Zostera marina]